MLVSWEKHISRFVLKTIIIDMSVLIYCGAPCDVVNYYMLINHCTCYPIRLGFITSCRAKVRLINNVQLISGWLIELQRRTCRSRVRTGEHFTSRRIENRRTVRKFDSSRCENNENRNAIVVVRERSSERERVLRRSLALCHRGMCERF